MCSGARVAAPSLVLQYLAQEKLSALVLRILEELLKLITLDDLVRVDKEYPIGHGFVEANFIGHAQHGHAGFHQTHGPSFEASQKVGHKKSALWFDELGGEMVRCYMAAAIFPRLNLNA
jgi:hypothetical protein